MKNCSIILIISFSIFFCLVSCGRMISENTQNTFTTLYTAKSNNLSSTSSLKLEGNTFEDPTILEKDGMIFVFVIPLFSKKKKIQKKKNQER